MTTPYRHLTRTRVRYAETDKAGVVYHSNYLIYFEIGRTDLMRSLGVPYRDLEVEENVVLAVVHCDARFRRPARYDDPLRIESFLMGLTNTRIRIGYEVYHDEDDSLLCSGETTLASVRDGKVIRMPEIIANACEGKF